MGAFLYGIPLFSWFHSLTVGRIKTNHHTSSDQLLNTHFHWIRHSLLVFIIFKIVRHRFHESLLHAFGCTLGIGLCYLTEHQSTIMMLSPMQLEIFYHVLASVKTTILKQNTLSLCCFMTTIECTLPKGQGPTNNVLEIMFIYAALQLWYGILHSLLLKWVNTFRHVVWA